jgi:hypothetical protein
MDWWRQRSSSARFLACAIVVILAFFMAVGVGAGAALLVRGDQSGPAGVGTGSGKPGSQGASRGDQNTYVHDVGRIQAASVETFLDSHMKLRRYDALNSGDIEKMQSNQANLQRLAAQARALRAPKKYGHQKDAFVSAIEELHTAARVAYALAADPTSATETGFRKYDGHVEKATALLKQPNDLLDRDYKTIEGVRSIGTS